jgi:hypothetical protein
MEGRHCFEPMSGCLTGGRILPIVEFAHAASGADNCSVTGGYVYRGERFALLRGGYFFADYCSDRIWVVSSTAPSQAVATLLPITTSDIVSFGQDEKGELYVVSLGGSIQQIVELSRYPGSGPR